MRDEIGQVRVDPNLESYSSLWDKEWANNVYAITEPHAKLLQLIRDVMLSWQTANHVHRMPTLLVDTIGKFYGGFMRGGTSRSTMGKITDKLAEEIKKNVRLAPSKMNEIHDAIGRIAGRVRIAERKAASTFSADDTWQQYLKTEAFGFGIWGSQRLAYVGLFNGYDALLRGATKVVLPTADVSSTRAFKAAFRKAFDDEMLVNCWTTPPVNIARVARNSLSHAAGRITKDLRSVNHDFEIEDGRIQVQPKDTRALFDLLKDRVTLVAEAAALLPAFD